MIVTRQFILDNRTHSGGWVFAQLALLGAGWPPQKGWISRAEGAEITDEAAAMFVELGKSGKQSGKARKQTRRDAEALAKQIRYADTSKRGKAGVTYIHCPYAEKDAAKALGARWDVSRSMWYVPDNLDISLFKQWLNHQKQTDKKPPAKSRCVTVGKHHEDVHQHDGLLPWEDEEPAELIRLVRDIGLSQSRSA